MSRTVFYCRCGARLDGMSARMDHRCPSDAAQPTTRLFKIYDTNPLGTEMRESAAKGQPVFLCGRAGVRARELGDVEATNAANAILAARARWPMCAVEYMDAVECR